MTNGTRFTQTEIPNGNFPKFLVNGKRPVLRWFQITERRSYNVASPNALWHIDGNHKLVR